MLGFFISGFHCPLPATTQQKGGIRDAAHSAFSFTSALRTCPLSQTPGGAFPKTSFKFHFLPDRDLVDAVAPLSCPNPHPASDPDCRSPPAPSPCRAPRPIPRYQTGQADGDVETGAAPARCCRRYELRSPPTSRPRHDSATKCGNPCTAPDDGPELAYFFSFAKPIMGGAYRREGQAGRRASGGAPRHWAWEGCAARSQRRRKPGRGPLGPRCSR